jgi:ribonuclease R
MEQKYVDFVAKASKQSSEKERNAIEAERAVDDYYKMLYISDYIGEEFDGVVSGVMSFGIFVELDNAIEGIIRIEDLPLYGRRIMHDEKSFTISDGRITYKLGQKVKIKVAGVDIAERRAQFVLCNE